MDYLTVLKIQSELETIADSFANHYGSLFKGQYIEVNQVIVVNIKVFMGPDGGWQVEDNQANITILPFINFLDMVSGNKYVDASKKEGLKAFMRSLPPNHRALMLIVGNDGIPTGIFPYGYPLEAKATQTATAYNSSVVSPQPIKQSINSTPQVQISQPKPISSEEKPRLPVITAYPQFFYTFIGIWLTFMVFYYGFDLGKGRDKNTQNVDNLIALAVSLGISYTVCKEKPPLF